MDVYNFGQQQSTVYASISASVYNGFLSLCTFKQPALVEQKSPNGQGLAETDRF